MNCVYSSACSVLEFCAILDKDCLVIHMAALILKPKLCVNTEDGLVGIKCQLNHLEFSRKRLSAEKLYKLFLIVGMS